MTQKGPSSFHDLVAALSTHAAEDASNFDGMKKAFTSVENTQKALDQKQDEQTRKLDALLENANDNALERGRRVEREETERKDRKKKLDNETKWQKRFRYIILPAVAILASLLTKWLLK